MKLEPVAKLLILIGVASIIIGVLWQLGILQALRLGRLPGDIVIERKNMRFYFPITTGILVSLVLSAISWILRR